MNNVKASELRQGNIINVLYSSLARPSMEPRIMQAIVRGADDKTVITDCAGVPNEDKCSGIPLTEDWAIKFGFRKGQNPNGLYFYKRKNDIFRIYLPGAIHLELEYGTYCPIIQSFEYVHQLQNIYFCLTGEELKIKE